MKEHKSVMVINLSMPSKNSDEEKFNNIHFFEFERYIENELNYTTTICFSAFIICTTLFGNSAILITIWKTSSLHSAANILLSSLAVSDLAVGLIVQPLFIASVQSRMYPVFMFFVTVSTFFSIASFFTVTAFGIERLLALQLHLRYHAVVTQFRVTWVVIFIYFISAVIASSSLWVLGAPSVVYISFIFGNFVVYIKIYLIIRRHQRQIQHQQRQQQDNIFSAAKRFKKTALKTFLVCILLVCCYMPYSLVVKIALIAGLHFPPKVYSITVALIFLNSSINPLLYCWRDNEIRTALKQLFCC